VAAPLPNLAPPNMGRSAMAGYLKTLAAESIGQHLLEGGDAGDCPTHDQSVRS
jgi:hypothetical protein